MVRQRTLRNVIKATGIGLHFGEKVYLTLAPAPVNTGIVFRRVDLEPALEIPARAENLGDTTLSTSITLENERVSTEEHLLSAMAGWASTMHTLMSVPRKFLLWTVAPVPLFFSFNRLAQGGGVDNTIVIDEYRILNRDGLRYDNEFVKHKVLDAVGDPYLIGCSIIGQYRACKSGYSLNNGLLRALIAQPAAWEVVTFEGDIAAPISCAASPGQR